MNDIINCFFHVIEDTGENYKYTFAVPNESGIGIRHLNVGYVESAPTFIQIPCSRELNEQLDNIKKWFRQNLT